MGRARQLEAHGDNAPRRRLLPSETAVLASVFETCERPSSDVRASLAARLGLSERSVQIWFQNKRAKLRRDAADAAQRSALVFYAHAGHDCGRAPPPPCPAIDSVFGDYVAPQRVSSDVDDLFASHQDYAVIRPPVVAAPRDVHARCVKSRAALEMTFSPASAETLSSPEGRPSRLSCAAASPTLRPVLRLDVFDDCPLPTSIPDEEDALLALLRDEPNLFQAPL